MATASASLPVGYFLTIPVIDYGPDGVTPDTVEAISVSSSQPGFASAVVDPADHRLVKVTGLLAGTTVITIGAPGVPAGAAQLVVTVTVTPPPNYSKIEIGPPGISTPQPV